MDHYPVKQRRQPRRLNPNTDGITWLEAESEGDTEICSEEVFEDDGIKYTRAFGRVSKSYPRPMFQIIPNAAFSVMGQSVTPCQCDRFDQSWNCEIHPEVAWDTERKRWKLPCTGDRTRYDYDLAQDRWVPDTGDALGDFRAGGEVGASLYDGIQIDISFLAALTGPRTLEIHCDTEQGAGPLQIDTEPGRGA